MINSYGQDTIYVNNKTDEKLLKYQNNLIIYYENQMSKLKQIEQLNNCSKTFNLELPHLNYERVAIQLGFKPINKISNNKDIWVKGKWISNKMEKLDECAHTILYIKKISKPNPVVIYNPVKNAVKSKTQELITEDSRNKKVNIIYKTQNIIGNIKTDSVKTLVVQENYSFNKNN